MRGFMRGFDNRIIAHAARTLVHGCTKAIPIQLFDSRVEFTEKVGRVGRIVFINVTMNFIINKLDMVTFSTVSPQRDLSQECQTPKCL